MERGVGGQSQNDATHGRGQQPGWRRERWSELAPRPLRRRANELAAGSMWAGRGREARHLRAKISTIWKFEVSGSFVGAVPIEFVCEYSCTYRPKHHHHIYTSSVRLPFNSARSIPLRYTDPPSGVALHSSLTLCVLRTLHRILLRRPPSQHILPYTPPPTPPPTLLCTTPLRVSSHMRRRTVLLLLYHITGYNAPPTTQGGFALFVIIVVLVLIIIVKLVRKLAPLHILVQFLGGAGTGARRVAELDGSRGEGRCELRG